MTAVADGPLPDSTDLQDPSDRRKKRHPKTNATTGASAAGIRALSVQFMTFYFRAPIKAFFRSRIEYVCRSKLSAPANTAQLHGIAPRPCPGNRRCLLPVPRPMREPSTRAFRRTCRGHGA